MSYFNITLSLCIQICLKILYFKHKFNNTFSFGFLALARLLTNFYNSFQAIHFHPLVILIYKKRE